MHKPICPYCGRCLYHFHHDTVSALRECYAIRKTKHQKPCSGIIVADLARTAGLPVDAAIRGTVRARRIQ